jgi:toxin ParE1/3/4
MVYKVLFDERVEIDLEEALNYYQSINIQTLNKFYADFKQTASNLEINPFFQQRYGHYRCLPFKVFPYMLHFTIDETQRTVFVHALINTSRDPKLYWLFEK